MCTYMQTYKHTYVPTYICIHMQHTRLAADDGDFVLVVAFGRDAVVDGGVAEEGRKSARLEETVDLKVVVLLVVLVAHQSFGEVIAGVAHCKSLCC